MERFHLFLKQKLEVIFRSSGATDWPNWLNDITMRYDANWVFSVDEAPHYLVFGKTCRDTVKELNRENKEQEPNSKNPEVNVSFGVKKIILLGIALRESEEIIFQVINKAT